MHSLLEIFQNETLFAALTGWFVAQALKIPLYRIVDGKWDWRRFFGSGGMPSSHTASMVALTIMVGFLQGFATPLFAVSFMITTVVMYDATGVRRETGTQAEIINEIVKHVIVDGKPITNDELKELVGHTPLEVLGGAIVGILVATLYLVF